MTSASQLYALESAELRRVSSLVGQVKKRSGLTYRDFCAKTGVGQEKQGPCERGEGVFNFTALTLIRVARVDGKTLAGFLEGEV